MKIDNMGIPFLFGGVSLFLLYLWQTQPYKDIYKHATLNEYVNQ